MEQSTGGEDPKVPPPIPTPHSRAQTALVAVLRILVTAVLIPISVSIATSYYVNTHLLKPKLVVDYTSGDVSIATVEGRSNEFIAVLIDFYPGIEFPLPYGRDTTDEPIPPPVATGGEVVWAKKLRFKSEKDFVLETPRHGSRITKIMITNTGYASANHISIGLHVLTGTSKYKIISSPNIHTSEEVIAGSDVNPPFIRLGIDRLGASEKAILTIVTDQESGSETSGANTPFLTVHQKHGYGPVLYLTSDEGTGSISLNGISWKDETRWEQANFPDSTIGFWAAGIHARDGVTPVVEDIKKLSINYELVDDSGKHKADGTLKLQPDN
jgi:hypothetical protein